MKALKQGKYPYSKIIIYYVLIIGLVNAFALAFISVLMFKNETLVEVPFIFLVFSFFITTSPAFIFLSIWFCYKKYVFHQINDIYSLMKKSLFSFMVYLFFNLMIVWEKFVYSKANIIFIGISIVLFVLLSTFTFYQILPKTEKYYHQKRHRAKIKHRNKIRHALSPNRDTIPEENLVSKSILKENEIKPFDLQHSLFNLTKEKNNKSNYPRLMVLLMYTQYGGSIGGFLLVIAGFIYLFIEENNSIFFQYIDLGSFIISYLIIGFLVFLAAGIIGAIPAILTGAYIALFKIYLRSVWHYIHIFIVGFLFSSLIFREWWIGLIGGISSIIIGYVVVPKSEKDNGEDW